MAEADVAVSGSIETMRLSIIPRVKFVTGDLGNMGKRISAVKARGAVILGGGAMLKVLIISLSLIVLAFIVVAMNA